MTRQLFTPRPYQDMMRDHILAHPRCAIWAGMGLGKSVSTLSAVDILLLSTDDPVLILSPLRVATGVWPAEAHKWSHLSDISVVPIVGSETERLAAVRIPARVYTCNYDNLVWLVEYWGDRWPYRIVVADEATRLKGFRLKQGGVRARALGKIAHSKVDRFIQLSGTPTPNGLQDLWGMVWMLDKGERLGRTYEAFKNRWFQRSFDGYGVVPLPFAQKEIQERLADLCLAIDAADWFDLEKPIVTDIYIDLPARARVHYREMEDKMFTEMEGHPVEAFGAAARTQKLLQICSGAAYLHGENKEWSVLHNAKIDALSSVVEEAAGMPILVAYNFVSDLARLKAAFPQGRHLDKDTKTVDDWNAGKIPLLFAHPKSAGHGLNLQDGGNIIVYFAVNWNLEEHMQILERIGPTRQMQAGHERNVFVYRILARHTVDEMVLDRLDNKRAVQDILLDAMKRRATCGARARSRSTRAAA
jgi:SNF2 family DNA or RNA helicase